MQKTGRAAQVAKASESKSEIKNGPNIDHLVPLYDQFARAWDPLGKEAEQAEKDFFTELNKLYESVEKEHPGKFSVDDFRKYVVSRCRKMVQRQNKKLTFLQKDKKP